MNYKVDREHVEITKNFSLSVCSFWKVVILSLFSGFRINISYSTQKGKWRFIDQDLCDNQVHISKKKILI